MNPDFMTRAQLRRDGDEGMIEAFDAQPFQMLLHAFCESHSAEEPAAADREIQQAGVLQCR